MRNKRHKLNQDFLTHLGWQVEVTLASGRDVRGRVAAVNRQSVELAKDREPIRIPYRDIERATFRDKS